MARIDLKVLNGLVTRVDRRTVRKTARQIERSCYPEEQAGAPLARPYALTERFPLGIERAARVSGAIVLALGVGVVLVAVLG